MQNHGRIFTKETMNEMFETMLDAVTTLLPIVNPVGMAAVFLGYTAGLTFTQRVKVVNQITVGFFFLVAGSFVFGSMILGFFGIAVAEVQVAGGLVLFFAAWQLLNQSGQPEEHDEPTEESVEEIVFFPLTMPITAGTGTLSVAIALGAQVESKPVPTAVPHLIGGLLGIALVAGTVWLSYRYAPWLSEKLGRTGTRIVEKLSAFVLLAIGVQVTHSGLVALGTAG
jgi:multiple antibiotic resistance protein